MEDVLKGKVVLALIVLALLYASIRADNST
jgi:hypothetical protein